MTPWNETFSRVFTWRGALPKALRMHNLFVHSSLLLALPLTALALLLMLKVAPTDGDWKAVAFTLPVVWLSSLLVRVISQWLSVGWQGDEFELIIGPFGNLSHDYERLPAPTMMFYAGAGQAATLLAAFVGVFILGVVNTSPDSGVTAATLLDFHTGYSASAWASQIVWVNSLLFLMHLLPAVPFDARAFFVGWCRATNPALASSEILRLLSSTESHMGIGLGGMSVAMLASSISENNPVNFWAVLLVISIYLLIISHFEAYQAQHGDQQYDTPTPRTWRTRARSAQYAHGFDELDEFEHLAEVPSPHEILDIDEILRKLHREGQDALSAYEKEALLSASRELQARRQARS